ncbi:fibrinogen alpha chain-like [Drosophila bipectinata]|uniref:fibrinogen alpha chain-like n=1 Tax=Drosophila bipectinata TaxID=42026 RepID=UPI001C8AEC9C|nr:fibroleukin-like [Drosophila bipectinata]
MVVPVVLISAIFFISATVGSEESCYLTEEQEDECASICYPIVKPLLRYFEKCQGKEALISEFQKDFSALQKKYSDLQENHSELQSKYERLQSKIIDQKDVQIDLLINNISDLKGKSELSNLTNRLREEIEKMLKVTQTEDAIKNNQQNLKTQTKGMIAEQNNLENKTPQFPVPLDICSLAGIHEIRIPDSNPFRVICYPNAWWEEGYRWTMVYSKKGDSNKFNRNYEEYVSGFENPDTSVFEFFIGLDRLHHLTNEMRLSKLTLFFNRGRAVCDNFVVGNRSEGYMVKNIGKCIGDRHLGLRLGTKFTTFDRDEDGVPDHNLAKENGYGWWFNESPNSVPTRSELIQIAIRSDD